MTHEELLKYWDDKPVSMGIAMEVHKALLAVIALHSSRYINNGCSGCQHHSPCPTIQAIKGVILSE